MVASNFACRRLPGGRKSLLWSPRGPAFLEKQKGQQASLAGPSSSSMARPERFELPTTKFVAWYSIQLSYGRTELLIMRIGLGGVNWSLDVGRLVPLFIEQ
jgi:hypothetical protein